MDLTDILPVRLTSPRRNRLFYRRKGGPDLDQKCQRHLAEMLASARAYASTEVTLEQKMLTLAAYGGAIDVSRTLGLVSDAEAQDWNHRMLTILGLRSGPTAPVANVAASIVSDVGPVSSRIGNRTSEPHSLEPELVVSNLREEIASKNGRMRIIGYALYDASVRLIWECVLEADATRIFPGEMEDLERDISGLPDDEQDDIRSFATDQLIGRRVYQLELSDRLGTNYLKRAQSRTSHGGRSSQGWTEFTPRPPRSIKELTVAWQGASTQFPLSRN